MPVKLRLQRHGRKKIPYYIIIAVDGRKKRDGSYLESLGSYNPLAVPAVIEVNTERALYWLDNGAQPSDTVRAILKYKGVMFRKHLLRGVNKGILTQEQADAKWQEHVEAKQTAIVERIKSLGNKEKDEQDKRLKAEVARKEAMLEKRAKKLKAQAEAAAAPAEAEPTEEAPKTIDDVAREAAVERGDMTAEEAEAEKTKATVETAEPEPPPSAEPAVPPSEEPAAPPSEEPAAEPSEEPKEKE